MRDNTYYRGNDPFENKEQAGRMGATSWANPANPSSAQAAKFDSINKRYDPWTKTFGGDQPAM